MKNHQNSAYLGNQPAVREFALARWQENALSTWLVYLEFAKKSFQRQLQYRIANYSGFVVNTFFFVVRAYIFMALYEHRGVVADYNVVEAITFTGLTQAMAMVIGIFGGNEIANAVKTGEVATDLMKPIDYQFFALSRQLGRSFYYLFFRGLPIFLYDGTVEEIKRRYGKKRRLVVDLAEDYGDVAVPGAEMIQRVDHRAWLQFDRDEVSASQLIAQITQKYDIIDLTLEEPEIETIVAGIYKDGIT